MGRALARSSATLAALRRTRACPVNRRRRSENPHGHGPAADGGRPVTAYRIYRCTRMASSGDGGRDHRPGFGSAPSRESSRKSAETFPPTAITFSAWRARATSIRFPSGGAESYRRAVTERRPPRHSAGTNASGTPEAPDRGARRTHLRWRRRPGEPLAETAQRVGLITLRRACRFSLTWSHARPCSGSVNEKQHAVHSVVRGRRRFESGAHPPESHLAGEPIES